MEHFRSALVSFVRNLPDEELLSLIRKKLQADGAPAPAPPTLAWPLAQPPASNELGQASLPLVRGRSKRVRRQPKRVQHTPTTASAPVSPVGVKDKIVAMVGEAGDQGISPGELQKATKLSGRQLRRVLGRLRAAKAVFRAGTSNSVRYGSSARAARVAVTLAARRAS